MVARARLPFDQPFSYRFTWPSPLNTRTITAQLKTICVCDARGLCTDCQSTVLADATITPLNQTLYPRQFVLSIDSTKIPSAGNYILQFTETDDDAGDVPVTPLVVVLK